MKHLLVHFFWLTLVSCAVVQPPHSETNTATKDYYVKQRNIFHLYYHVNQPNVHEEQVKIGKEYSIEANLDKYRDAKYVKYFINLHKELGLQKGKVFSIMDKVQRSQAVALYYVMYFAKDYDTFYKTACWAREYVNEQMFMYSLSVAILHRPDCKGLVLPHAYETSPSYFFNSEVIDQAYHVKMQGHAEHMPHTVNVGEDHSILINSNYSGWYSRYNNEQKMSYFTEDVGLNMYYYYYHLAYPFWMNSEQLGETYTRRGEHFYYVHQQLLARYYMERLSNNLGDIPTFYWDEPITTGYYPSMKYPNGVNYPIRPNNWQPADNDYDYHKYLHNIEDYERRIRDVIDEGYIVTKDGSHTKLSSYEDIEYLANLIDSNQDVSNTRLYKNTQYVARTVLGASPKPLAWYLARPAALENYRTCLRDPMFYQLFNKYMQYFEQYQNTFEPYTKEELSCPGVKIENVEVDKLITYFDNYDVDITNGMYLNEHEATYKYDQLIIKARQYRLNHKPFSVTANVNAEKDGKYVVRIYMGPKLVGKDLYKSLNENRLKYVELDRFVYEMKSGKNTIQRSSEDFSFYLKDSFTSRDLFKQVNTTLNENKDVTMQLPEYWNTLPQRLLLPKGWKGGMPAQVYVIVSTYNAPKRTEPSYFIPSAHYVDSLPYGYPFNRPIDPLAFTTSNMHFEDVNIYHK